MVNQDGVKPFEHMWTTNADQHFLVRQEEDYAICRIGISSILSVIIEDDDVYKVVQNKMVEAGVAILSFDDWLKVRNRELSIQDFL